MPRIEHRIAGWEARTLPLCNEAHLVHFSFLFYIKKLNFLQFAAKISAGTLLPPWSNYSKCWLFWMPRFWCLYRSIAMQKRDQMHSLQFRREWEAEWEREREFVSVYLCVRQWESENEKKDLQSSPVLALEVSLAPELLFERIFLKENLHESSLRRFLSKRNESKFLTSLISWIVW